MASDTMPTTDREFAEQFVLPDGTLEPDPTGVSGVPVVPATPAGVTRALDGTFAEKAETTPVVQDDEPAGADAPPSDGDEQVDDDAASEAVEQALDAEFLAALSKHGIDADLSGLPDDAKPVVLDKLGQMERGFTKAMQEARAYRKDEATLKAELKFQAEHPADFIVHLLRTKPELADAVNAQLDELEGKPTAAKAHDIVVKDARKTALEAVTGEQDTKETQARRTDEIVTYGQDAAKKAGIPFGTLVQNTIANVVLTKGDITTAEIDGIVTDAAKEFGTVAGERKRTQRADYVKDKVKDQKAGLKVRPNQGVTVTPPAKSLPKTDAEFKADFAARMAG